jgi:hypothetical protein
MRAKPENLKGRDHLVDLGIEELIILKCILEKYGGKAWAGFMFLRIGTSGELFFYHGNEPSVSIKCRGFLD